MGDLFIDKDVKFQNSRADPKFCAFLTLRAVAQGKQGVAWTLGITAVVYNPIIRVHLTRKIWSMVNIVTIIMAVASIFILKSEKEQKEGG